MDWRAHLRNLRGGFQGVLFPRGGEGAIVKKKKKKKGMYGS